MSAQHLRSLVERHIEPILVRAGFAAGQWAHGVAGGGISVIFCAAGDDYVHRHPDLVEVGDQWVDVHCVDITIEGSLDHGIDRFDVEFESLADLLARTGHDDDAAVLPSLLRLDDPDRDLQRVADLLSGLYAPEQDP